MLSTRKFVSLKINNRFYRNQQPINRYMKAGVPIAGLKIEQMPNEIIEPMQNSINQINQYQNRIRDSNDHQNEEIQNINMQERNQIPQINQNSTIRINLNRNENDRELDLDE